MNGFRGRLCHTAALSSRQKAKHPILRATHSPFVHFFSNIISNSLDPGVSLWEGFVNLSPSLVPQYHLYFDNTMRTTRHSISLRNQQRSTQNLTLTNLTSREPMKEPDLREPDLREPDLREPDLREPDMRENLTWENLT